MYCACEAPPKDSRGDNVSDSHVLDTETPKKVLVFFKGRKRNVCFIRTRRNCNYDEILNTLITGPAKQVKKPDHFFLQI